MTTYHQHSAPARIGLVGLGGHGQTLQLSAEVATSVDVVTVFDPNVEEMQAAAKRFGVEPASSFEALLAHDRLEAVVLASPNIFHRAQAEAAFAAGLDVLVEKPIANTVEDGHAMVAAAEAADRLLMVGHNMRRWPSMRRAKALLDANSIGGIVSFEVDFSSDTALWLPATSWRLRPYACPLLPMMQLGIHGVDLVHYLLGRVTDLYASARSVSTTAPVVDSVISLLRVESGVHGSLVANYASEPRFVYRIAGTEGTLSGTPHTLNATRRDGTVIEQVNTEDASFASYIDQMQVFGEAVRLRAHPETDGWAGLQALAVLEAMQVALDTGARAVVPDVQTLSHPTATVAT